MCSRLAPRPSHSRDRKLALTLLFKQALRQSSSTPPEKESHAVFILSLTNRPAARLNCIGSDGHGHFGSRTTENASRKPVMNRAAAATANKIMAARARQPPSECP